MLNKTLLGSAAVIMTMVGAQAADLPSKKAAPATYVKICDAYGAGFFFIPGTETCMKVGGYVRAEAQYAPGHNVYNGGSAVAADAGKLTQTGGAQDTSGFEVRGRAEFDARTPTAYGVARTLVWIRATNASGQRNTAAIGSAGAYFNNTGLVSNTQTTNSAGGTNQSNVTLERAMVQWAGFTFGVATENYADMPSVMYGSNMWAGYPNGMPQIAYTAVLGGGFSATLALEDIKAGNYGNEALTQPSTQIQYVANVRWDQSWGFVKLNGNLTNNSFWNDSAAQTVLGVPGAIGAGTGASAASVTNLGIRTKQGWAVGGTVMFNLPMLAAGDKLWLSANYSDGNIGQLLSTGSIWNGSSSAGGRIAGGVYMPYVNTVITNNAGAAALATNSATLGNTTGWNVGGLLTHYWDAKWRSNFAASYVSLTPPTSANYVVGNGSASTYLASLIYSPAANFDIGVELQYLTAKTSFNAGANGQTALAAFNASTAGAKLSGNGVSAKLRIERGF